MARLRRITCELFGSLALTGKGHGTDTAILLGLSGWLPEAIDPQQAPRIVADIRAAGTLKLRGDKPIRFTDSDIVFRMGEFLPGHPNALRFTARYAGGREIIQIYFSIGGGADPSPRARPRTAPTWRCPIPIVSGTELMETGAGYRTVDCRDRLGQ